MIYNLKFDLRRFQSIFYTLDFGELRSREISGRWDGLEEPGGWYHMTGLGSPVGDATIRQRLFDLFADYPNEMALAEPPKEPGDIVLEFKRPLVAFSKALEVKVPELLENVAMEGVLVDYPFGFSLDRIYRWLEDPKTRRKWPKLKNLEKHPVEIVDHGSRYMLCYPSVLEGYRIKLFYCTNWQHDLVDYELDGGRWHTWEADGVSAKYYRIDSTTGIVVFKRMPPAGTWLFRIPEDTGSVYCTQDFKDVYEAHGLKGVIFKPMALSDSYDPPPPPTPQPNRWEEERG